MRQGIKWNGGGFPALVQSKVVCGTETLFVRITYFPLGVPLPQRAAGNIYSYGTHSKVWSNNFAVFSGLIYTVYRALRREAKFNLCFLLNYRGISLLKNFGNRVSEQVNLLFCYPLKSAKIGVT